MATAEIPRYDPDKELRIQRDVDFAKNSFRLPIPYLKSSILDHHSQNLLVHDALEDVNFFYDDAILPESDTNRALQHVLQLAYPLPSEGSLSPTVTLIRLLHRIAQVDGFKIKDYGLDVAEGVKAMTQKSDETIKQYESRVDRFDNSWPYLHTKDTLGKATLLETLTPTSLASEQISDLDRYDYMSRYQTITNTLLPFFDKHDKGLWVPKIERGIALGRAALTQ